LNRCVFAKHLKPVPSDIPNDLFRTAPEEAASEIRKCTL
jgi:hypothetical protein